MLAVGSRSAVLQREVPAFNITLLVAAGQSQGMNTSGQGTNLTGGTAFGSGFGGGFGGQVQTYWMACC